MKIHMNRTAVFVATMLMVLGVTAQIAAAEISSDAEDTWGVYDSVLTGTQTDRVDTEVMAIEQIGNRIYVGGKFTNVRSWTGGTQINQRFLAAFDVNTGRYIDSFTPTFDAPVYSLQASPDGSRLFVGGEFGDVAGVPNTRALVALDPTTGAVDPTWKGQIKLNGRAIVYGLDAGPNELYVTGSFDAVGGARGVPLTPVTNAVKLNYTDGAPDLDWRPVIAGGGAWASSYSPDGSRVYLAGFFDTVSGAQTGGFAVVDNSTGQLISAPINHNNSNRENYYDVEAVNGLVFVAGMEHITYVLNASNLSVRTRHSSGGTTNAGFQNGGDFQDLEVVGDRVYAACHCRGSHFADGDIYNILRGLEPNGSYSREDPIRFVAAYSATDGRYLPSFTLDVSGSSGVWAIHADTNGCVWFGGDLTRAGRANGSNQSRGGFTKHCDPNVQVDVERPSVPSGVIVTPGTTNVNLNWNASNDNIGVTGYQIYRSTNGGPDQIIATPNSTSYNDTNLNPGTYRYYLRAIDAAGNQSWRTGYKTVTITGQPNDTERPSVPRGLMVSSVASTTATLTWTASTDNIGVADYVVFDSNGVVVTRSTSTSLTLSGLTPGTSYQLYVRAEDGAGNQSWRSNTVSFQTS